MFIKINRTEIEVTGLLSEIVINTPRRSIWAGWGRNLGDDHGFVLGVELREGDGLTERIHYRQFGPFFLLIERLRPRPRTYDPFTDFGEAVGPAPSEPTTV